MRRWLTRLAVLLLLGAIVNVAVAWVIGVAPADYSRPVGFAEPASDQPSRLANQMAMLAGTTTSKRYEFFNRFHATYGVQGVPDLDAVIPYWAAQYLSEEDLNRSRDAAYLVTARATGWPALSMSGGMRLNLSGITIEQSDWAILLPPPKPSRVDQSRIVPLRPIWPGFAINTVFYAALLWIVTLGPGTARRIIRRKRGQCIKCGYDLRGSSGGGGGGGCPECGWGREPVVAASQLGKKGVR